MLQNRGYDSAGMATVASKELLSKRGADASTALSVTKYASQGVSADSISLVRKRSEAHAGHSVGIAHTRWATHGGKVRALVLVHARVPAHMQTRTRARANATFARERERWRKRSRSVRCGA